MILLMMIVNGHDEMNNIQYNSLKYSMTFLKEGQKTTFSTLYETTIISMDYSPFFLWRHAPFRKPVFYLPVNNIYHIYHIQNI